MKKTAPLIVVSLGFLFLFACGGAPSVYVAGFYKTPTTVNEVACYWKDGVQVDLTDGKTNAMVFGIYIDGENVYTAGYYVNAAGKEVAAYWKNTVKTDLTDGKDNARAKSIYVNGEDVHVVGFYIDPSSTNDVVTYWKNGVKTNYTDPATMIGEANVIVVKGEDVYVGGYYDLPGTGKQLKAAYWKNGVKTDLTDGTELSMVTDMFVTDDHVYSTGFSTNLTTNISTSYYWTDTTKTALSDGIEDFASITGSIYVDGEDVYASNAYAATATSIQPVYWKNTASSQTNLPLATGYNYGFTSSTFVKDGSVYIAGSFYKPDPTDPSGKTLLNVVAMYWKDGVSTILSSTDNGKKAVAYAIKVM